MAGRYDRVNGAWEKVRKRYDKINGAWTPVKKRYDKVNGVWLPSYSGSITWTYSSDGPYLEVQERYSGADSNHALYMFGYDHESAGTGKWSCTVTYTFSTPILVRAGQSITMNWSGDTGIDVEVRASNMDLWLGDTLNTYKISDTHTFATDTTVTQALVKGTIIPGAADQHAYIGVALETDAYGTISLNSTCSSD